MHDHIAPNRAMPLVVAAALAMVSLCTLLLLPGDHDEARVRRPAPTTSITTRGGAGLADAARPGFPRGLASDAPRGGRMTSR